MGLFSAFVKTAIETAMLPVAVVKDIVTLGNVAEHDGRGNPSFIVKKLKEIKEASEDK